MMIAMLGKANAPNPTMTIWMESEGGSSFGPGSPPNGGPATPLDKSGATEEPTSVS